MRHIFIVMCMFFASLKKLSTVAKLLIHICDHENTHIISPAALWR